MAAKKHGNSVLIFIVFLSLFVSALLFFGAQTAFAGTVKPCTKAQGLDDTYNIQQELDTKGSVTLVDGKTYHLSSPLHLSSNMKINAKTATIISQRPLMFNIPECTKYKAIENLTIKGGYWKFGKGEGYIGSSIKITHGNNIKFQNVKIRHNNAKGHAIELVACQNVVIQGCDLAPLGEDESKTEETIQLDVATHSTAYFLEGVPFKTELASKLQNGATCKNITIKDCTVKGNRGIVANYTAKEDGKYLTKLHENIIIKDNKITSAKGEGVALFNTKSATVSGNQITCNAPGDDSYTVGLHVASFGKTKKLKEGKITLSGNKVKGGRQAIHIFSHTTSKFGTVSVKENKLYCRQGKDFALNVKKEQCTSLKNSKNKTYDWNN